MYESQPDILQDICHPGMGAAAENGQTGRCVYYEALLVGKAVGDIGFSSLKIKIIALRNGGVICRAVRDKPTSAGQFEVSGDKLDAVVKPLEKAFPDPDILHCTVFQAKTVFFASGTNKKRRGFVQRKESIQTVGMVIMRMRQDTDPDRSQVDTELLRTVIFRWFIISFSPFLNQA